MIHQIINTKGEGLYMLVESYSDSLCPLVTISTWEECIKLLDKKLHKSDIIRIVHKDITEDTKIASVSVECINCTLYFYIRQAYTEKW